MSRPESIKQYAPSVAPREFGPEFLEWLRSEFLAVSQAASQSAAQEVNLDQLGNPPVRVSDGMIRFADGTAWNPGSGRGAYIYDSVWKLLQGTGGTGTGGITEAPSDGKTYGRNNAAWVEVAAGGGSVPMAVLDSGTYGASIATNDAFGFIPSNTYYDLGGIFSGSFTPVASGVYQVDSAFHFDLLASRTNMIVEISLRNSAGSTKVWVKEFKAPYDSRYMNVASAFIVSLTAGTQYLWWLKRVSGGADHNPQVQVGTQVTRLT